MKVAMISPNRESEKAISLISANLVKGIKNKGFDIDLLTYQAGSPYSFFKILKKLKNYDIIHIQHEYGLLGYKGIPFYPIFLYLKLLNKKIVTTMHTPRSPNQKVINESYIKGFLKKILYMSQNSLIYHTSDIIHVNENFFKDVLSKDYGIKREKIKVIPQPVPEPILIPKIKAKKMLNLSGNVYLIIGTLHYDVGADIIIKQADKIGKTILFVTNPKGANTRSSKVKENVDYNKNIVKQKHFENFVRFDLKEMPADDKLWWTYFSSADLVLQAYREGIRSGIFSDAMVGGVPVVSSNIRFFKEISKKYKSVKTVENEKDYPKAIRWAMEPKHHKQMVKECERYAKDNSLANISEEYKEMYKNILK